jgi:hypothetical protein
MQSKGRKKKKEDGEISKQKSEIRENNEASTPAHHEMVELTHPVPVAVTATEPEVIEPSPSKLASTKS